MLRINRKIYILGMHRSGTSVVTRLINLLGAEVGKNLLPGNPGINEKGFWENRELIDVHDDMLAEMDSAWFDFRELPQNWWQSNRFAPYKSIISAILERDYERFDFMVLKDPRLCRLLPFYLDSFKDIVKHPLCLLVLRNPIEVVSSLAKRDGFDPEFSALLWLSHVLDAEYYSRSYVRAFTCYDLILNDWRLESEKIAQVMNLHWPNPIHKINKVVDAEIDPALRHHLSTENNSEGTGFFTEQAVSVYNRLISEDKIGLADFLDNIRTVLSDEIRINGPLATTTYRTNLLLTRKAKQCMHLEEQYTTEFLKMKQRYFEMEQELNQLNAEYSSIKKAYQEALHLLQGHWSWRLGRRILQIVNGQ